MTTDEKQIAKNFILAQTRVTHALEEMRRAQALLSQAAKDLTEAWWATDERDNTTATIPENFVIELDGLSYFISIDTEGEHNHDCQLVRLV